MDIGHQRNVDTAADDTEGLRSLHSRNCAAYDLTARLLQLDNLAYCRLHILGLRICHRLDGYRSIAAYGRAAYHNLT